MMTNFSVPTEFANVFFHELPELRTQAGLQTVTANQTGVVIRYAGVSLADNIIHYIPDAVTTWREVEVQNRIATQTMTVIIRTPDWFVVLQFFVLIVWWLHTLVRFTRAVRNGADLAAAGFYGRMIKMISYPTYEEAREIFQDDEAVERTARDFMLKTQLNLDDAKTVDLFGLFMQFLEMVGSGASVVLIPYFMLVTSRDGAILAMCCFMIGYTTLRWAVGQYAQYVVRRLDSYRNWYNQAVRPVTDAYLPVALPSKLETSFAGSQPTPDFAKKTHFMRLYTAGMINGVYTAVKDDGEVYLVSTCHQVLAIMEDVPYTMETRADGRILHRVPATKWIPILCRPDIWDETTDIAIWKGTPVKALCATMQITPLELETKLNPNRESAVMRLHAGADGATEIQHGACVRSESKPFYFSHYMSTRPGDSGAPILSAVSGRLMAVHTGWDVMPDGDKANQAFTSHLIRLATARYTDEIPQASILMSESDTMHLQYKLNMVSQQLADRVRADTIQYTTDAVVFKTKDSDKLVEVTHAGPKGSFATVREELHVPREKVLVEKTAKGIKHMTLAKAVHAEDLHNAADAALALSKINTHVVTVKGKSVTAITSVAADFSWYARKTNTPYVWDADVYRDLARAYYDDMPARNQWAKVEKTMTPAQRKEYFPLLAGKNTPDALNKKEARVQGFEMGTPNFTQFVLPTTKAIHAMTTEEFEAMRDETLPKNFRIVKTIMANHATVVTAAASRPEALRLAIEWIQALRAVLEYMYKLAESRVNASRIAGTPAPPEMDRRFITVVAEYYDELTEELFNADSRAVKVTVESLAKLDATSAPSDKVHGMVSDERALIEKIDSKKRQIDDLDTQIKKLKAEYDEAALPRAAPERAPFDIDAARALYEEKIQKMASDFEARREQERVEFQKRMEHAREQSDVKIANLQASHEQLLTALSKREGPDPMKAANALANKEGEKSSAQSKHDALSKRRDDLVEQRLQAIERMMATGRVASNVKDSGMNTAATRKLAGELESQRIPQPEPYKGKGFKCKHPACPDPKMAHTQRSCRLNWSKETPYWCEASKCPLKEPHLVWMCPGNGPDVPLRYQAPMPDPANRVPAMRPSAGEKQGSAPITSPYNQAQKEFLLQVKEHQAGRGWPLKTFRLPMPDGKFCLLLLNAEEIEHLKKLGAGQSSKTATCDQ